MASCDCYEPGKCTHGVGWREERLSPPRKSPTLSKQDLKPVEASHSKTAYAAGAEAALQKLGLARAAAPGHLPAERLAKTLSELPLEYTARPGMKSREKRLERPVRWGAPASLEATGSPSRDYSGNGPYSGV